MRKHQEVTLARILRFKDHVLKDRYYVNPVPLEVSYYNTKEPLSFEKANDAKFRSIKRGKKWGTIFDCAWFKFEGIVPENFKGKTVVAVIDVGGEACLYDETGNPIQGLTNKKIGWTLNETIIKKRVFLHQVAQGGETVSLMVDAGANNILGVENVLTYESMEDGYLNSADLAIFDWELFHLFIDFDLLYQLATELPPNSRHRALIIYALNDVVNKFGKGTDAEVKTCRRILRHELDKPANASSLTAIAIGHAHIDIAWLWPLRETVRKTARTFSTALTLMDQYQEYKFGASQPQLYQMMKDNYPGLYERLKKAVKRGQWECQGAMWVESDCNLPSGESLVRQVLYGKKFFKEEFGVEVNNLWLPDVFGYSAALPQILIKSDVKYFMTQKISWNQFNKFPHHTFIWKGLDGTPIFSHFLAPNNYRSDCGAKDLMNLERENTDVDRTEFALFLYGAGDGGGGPSQGLVERLKRAESLEDLPKVKMAFSEDYFESAELYCRDLQTWTGELYLELHRGTLTTHAATKFKNRFAEFLFREVELLFCQSQIDKYPQQELETNWKTLLLNQFHDIIPGTSITRVHKESYEQYDSIIKTLKEFKSQAEKYYVESIDNQIFNSGYVVKNSLSWPREGFYIIPESLDSIKLRDAEGNPVLAQPIYEDGVESTLVKALIPQMGHTIIGETNEENTVFNDLTVTENKLENSLLKVVFDQSGRIIEIFDKEINREVLKPGGLGNEFRLYEDIPNLWDAWDIDIFYEEVQPSSPELTACKILEKGPLRACLEFEYEGENYTIKQKVILHENDKMITFDSEIDWRETNKMLRVEFPLNLHSLHANFDIQYGHVSRTTHYNTSWDLAQFEVVAHKWADISQSNYGVALINNGKYGHKVKDNVISLNLLRSPKTPDPSADMHVHNFKYALLPHAGDHLQAGVIQKAYEFNVSASSMPIGLQKGDIPSSYSWLKVAEQNIILEAVKKHEYEDAIILRFYESYGQDTIAHIGLNFDFKEVKLVNIIEREIGDIDYEGGLLKISFKPFEIHTFKVILKK